MKWHMEKKTRLHHPKAISVLKDKRADMGFSDGGT